MYMYTHECIHGAYMYIICKWAEFLIHSLCCVVLFFEYLPELNELLSSKKMMRMSKNKNDKNSVEQKVQLVLITNDKCLT